MVRFTGEKKKKKSVEKAFSSFSSQWKAPHFWNRWDNPHKCSFITVLMLTVTDVS